MKKRIIIGIFLATILFSTSIMYTQNASAQVIPDWVKNTTKWYDLIWFEKALTINKDPLTWKPTFVIITE